MLKITCYIIEIIIYINSEQIFAIKV